MSLITGPKRAFGVGELKQQNAVIKVYTVGELKNALTKIYQLPSGVGTIEIAGDIIITEPIKLKRFLFGKAGPTEIIIQAIGGAKIINGNKVVNQGYNWDQTGNNGIPVFDFEKIDFSANPLSKYTFKDLTINTEASYPIGAFIAGDLGGETDTISGKDFGLITILNLKMFNVWNLFGAYDSIGTFTPQTIYTWISPRVDNLLYRNSSNTEFAMTTTYINHKNIGCFAGNFTNISVWNFGQLAQAEDDLTIINNSQLIDNTFSNLYCRLNIELPDRTNVGGGNTISAVNQLVSTNPECGFSYINTNLPNNTFNGNSTYFDANAAAASFSYGNGNITTDPLGTSITVTPSTLNFVTFGTPQVDLPNTTVYSHYIVDWNLIIKQRTTELVNYYNIKTILNIDNSGTGTILDSSTLYAYEGITSAPVTGLNPAWNNTTKVLSLSPAGPTNIVTICDIKVTGFKHPNLG
jgi:hypothetical protein